MFTPKNIQGALEELYDLCDPDYMVDMLVNYSEEFDDISPALLAKSFQKNAEMISEYRVLSSAGEGIDYQGKVLLNSRAVRLLSYVEDMLIVQDQVWGRVTANRSAGKSTRYYIDEFHLLLKEEQTATYSVEIWKRFRKWGGLPTGITQNVKDLLRSPEIANILENSDFIYMLNQASDDRSILAQRLNISPHQLSYVTNSGEGEGLLFYGNVILPFIDRFPTDLELYRIMTTKLNEVAQEKEA